MAFEDSSRTELMSNNDEIDNDYEVFPQKDIPQAQLEKVMPKILENLSDSSSQEGLSNKATQKIELIKNTEDSNRDVENNVANKSTIEFLNIEKESAPDASANEEVEIFDDVGTHEILNPHVKIGADSKQSSPQALGSLIAERKLGENGFYEKSSGLNEEVISSVDFKAANTQSSSTPTIYLPIQLGFISAVLVLLSILLISVI
jgi:hypothetical protein